MGLESDTGEWVWENINISMESSRRVIYSILWGSNYMSKYMIYF